MHLNKLFSKFDLRCRSYDTRATQIITNRSNLSNWEFNYQTEVLISDIWQSWNTFTRALLFSSCRGTKARDGSTITKRNLDNSWKRLGYEAKQGAFGSNTTASGHSNFMIRKEPTWGDLDKISRIISSLGPNNKNILLTTYGSFSVLKDLQLVRNACAHKNIETLNSLTPLASRYRIGILKNAPQTAWAIGVSSNDYAIERWISEMKLIADLATSSS